MVDELHAALVGYKPMEREILIAYGHTAFRVAKHNAASSRSNGRYIKCLVASYFEFVRVPELRRADFPDQLIAEAPQYRS